MNIESKNFKVKDSGLARSVHVIVKATNRVFVVDNAPSASYLAAMNERQFDRECAEAIIFCRWPSIGA